MTNNQLTSTHLAVKSELDGYKIHASRGQATAMAMVRLFESIDRDLEELQERRQAAAKTITLTTPACTYADHSYPAYTKQQVLTMLESLGVTVVEEDV
ncbi:hypothetical protein KAH87_18930 [Klebsiella quasipneumoniae]|uniref:hypothetical protein n=1 Tax=Klebsiella pneumoniae complex TaxID=3390273 RepID=UPI001F03E5A6|nr:hypothetical protein [Klebsiella pneumoniae]